MNREDLKNYKYSQKWVKEQLDYFEEQRTRVLSITQVLSDMPKAQNKPNDALEELMDAINDFIKQFTKQQNKLNNIMEQLSKITPLHRLVLTENYINNKSLEEISTIINYSYYRTCRINGEALNEFDKVGNLGQDLATIL
jgi:DNA-directed RNA polymerase specialized sigma subunit